MMRDSGQLGLLGVAFLFYRSDGPGYLAADPAPTLPLPETHYKRRR